MRRLVARSFSWLALLHLCACNSTPAARTELMRHDPRIEASASELRLKMRAFAHRFAHRVERAADELALDCPDPAVRLAALQWKIHAIPLAQTTCYLADPLAAMTDTWALAVQQRMHFEGGGAERLFGERARIALEAARKIEADLEELVRSVAADERWLEGREDVRAWAAAHPLPETWSGRESLVPHLSEFVGSASLGALARVGKLEEDLGDVAMRLSLYNELLPSQARWQAEFLLLESGTLALVEELRALLPALGSAASSASALEARAEAMLEARLSAALLELRRERELVLAFLEETRHDSHQRLRADLDHLTERIADERRALVASLEEVLVAQWPRVRADLPEVAARSMTSSGPELSALADRLLLRLGLLGLGGLVLAFFGGLLLVRVACWQLRPTRSAG